MELERADFIKITAIILDATGETPFNLRIERGAIRFTVFCGMQLAGNACKTLLGEGLQHTNDDGKPEYFRTGTDFGDRVDVRWPVKKGPLWVS